MVSSTQPHPCETCGKPVEHWRVCNDCHGMPASLANPDARIARFRALGATRVRIGDVEVEWQHPPAPQSIAAPGEPSRPETETERRLREERELYHSGG